MTSTVMVLKRKKKKKKLNSYGYTDPYCNNHHNSNGFKTGLCSLTFDERFNPWYLEEKKIVTLWFVLVNLWFQ